MNMWGEGERVWGSLVLVFLRFNYKKALYICKVFV
jgi:hypothetical protein